MNIDIRVIDEIPMYREYYGRHCGLFPGSHYFRVLFGTFGGDVCLVTCARGDLQSCIEKGLSLRR